MRIRDWSSDVCSSDLPRDLEQAPRRHAVDAALVLVGLLVGHADHLRELLLSEPQHCAALTDALADILLDALDSCRNCFHSISPFQLGVAPDEIGRASCRERVCQYV